MSELVGKNLGKYRIVAYLGGGGMAHVYKAYHPGLDWHVAIKLMKSDLAARRSSANRFEREAVAVARLRHPNIVQVHDFDAQDSLRYMVMEFIEGPTLRAELIARRDKGQSFSLAETAHLFSALASALDYAHARGVIHHDLKPDNVMITPDGQVVLTDFGIAQMRDIVASETASKEVIGTAEYMAPEQIEGERGDRRSDIYSLGVMLFELTIGRVPFEGTPLAVMLKHINETLPLPTTFNPQLPPSVEQVILKSLNKKPAERYQTAGELSQVLAAAVGLIGEQQAASYFTAVAIAPHISEISLTPDRPPLSPSAPIPPCPYRGLFAFQEKDAPFFFGREAFVGQLLEAVQRQTLVAVLGPSGSGKSSVIFAGLLPRLRKGETGRLKDEISSSALILHSSSFLIASFRPGSRPFHALAAALLPLQSSGKLTETDHIAETERLTELLRQGRTTLPTLISQILQQRQPGSRVLLVIDQFEEVFTLCPEPQTRQRFIDELLAAATAGQAFGTGQLTPTFTLLVTMRADFLGQALTHRDLADALQEADVKLGPMTRQELDRAIENPAGRQGVLFEKGLAARILDDVGEEPGKLPLLEFALTLLWERQVGGLLTHQAYEAIGGVEGALAHYADEVYATLNPAQQEQARRLFLQLVRPGQRTEDTRRVATRAEVGEANWTLAQGLASARLVVTSRDAAGEETVEVAHEALIRGWTKLREWVNSDRAFRTWQERLRMNLRQWEASRQDEAALLRGNLLAEAEGWYRERASDLGQAEQLFIQESLALQQRLQAAQERQRQQRVQRLYLLLGVSAVALVVMLGLAGFSGFSWLRASRAAKEAETQRQEAETQRQEAEIQRQEAEIQRQEAETQRQEAEAAAEEAKAQRQLALGRQLLGQGARYAAGQPDLALLLSLEAGRIAPAISLEANHTLFTGLETNPHLMAFLRGHFGNVNSVAFNPDGTSLASAGGDYTIILWDIKTRQPLGPPLVGHTDWVGSVAFSPDGSLLASVSDDQTIILWNLKTFQPRHQLTGPASWVWTVAFSRNGKMLASADTDKNIFLWDVETGRQLGQPLIGHQAIVRSVAFSPTGDILASADDTGVVILWDISRRRQVDQLALHTERVNTITFSPDGQTLASGSLDTTIILWDLTTQPYRPRGQPLTGHTNTVLGLAFSPDGQTLASSSWDKTVILWDVTSQQPLGLPLTGHREAVEEVAFSPDGKTLASASADDTVILWDMLARQRLAEPMAEQPGAVWNVAFSPAGTLLASAGADNRIILWDALTGQRLGQPLIGHTADVQSLAFSSDGTLLASASSDQTIVLWDVPQRRQLYRLKGHTDWVKKVAFSRDDKILASAGGDQTIILWDVATGQPLGDPLTGHKDAVRSVAFSPTSDTLASAGDDDVVILWDIAQRRQLGRLTEHEDDVYALAFSPDGQTLASGSRDHTIILWDLTSRLYQSRRLAGHDDSVLNLAFSPDGQTLASSSWDQSIILWNIATGQPHFDPLTGHTRPADGLAFSPDGQTLASADRAGEIFLWNVLTGESRLPPLTGHRQSVWSVAVSPGCAGSPEGCSQTLAWGSEDGTITLWDIPNAKPIDQPLDEHTSWVNDLDFSPDGQLLASASGDQSVILWDVLQHQQLDQLSGHTDWVRSVAFSPDGKILASAGDDTTIILWDVLQRQQLDQLSGHTDWVRSIAFSPDGKILASAGDDTTIILWDVATRQPLGPPLVGHSEAVYGLAFSRGCASPPEGCSQTLASASVDNTLILWDVQTGRPLGQPLRGHGSWVGSVAFSPDGTLLASAGGDKRIILWNVATWQPLEPPLAGHTAAVQDLAFSPDGQTLISVSEDGAIIRWDMSLASWQARACQVAGRNLTWTEWQQYLGDQPYRLTCPDAPAGLVELFNRGDTFAQAGQKQPAAAAFEQAVALVQETNSDVLNNQVCWFGSLDGLPEVVLPACERAVELASEDNVGFYRDSRGLAYALQQEYDQAIADFEAFVKWSKEHNLYEHLRLKREEWIKELKAGRNPFDAEILAALRNEN